MPPKQPIDREQEATRAATGYALECIALAVLQVIASVSPENPTKYGKAAFFLFLLPALTALWAYGAWRWWRHTEYLSTTRRVACLVTGCASVTVSMICWAFHPTPKFEYAEFLVFIFWPSNFGFIVGLLVPLRFIRWGNSSDTDFDEITEKV